LVDIAMSYGLNGRDSIPGRGKWFSFSTPQCPDRFWNSPSLSNVYRGCFPLRVKRLGREADHSPPSSAQVKNDGTLPPPPCNGTDFLRVLRFPRPVLTPPTAPHSSIIRDWYNRPNSGQWNNRVNVLMIEAICSSETSSFLGTTRGYFTEDENNFI
jgi:hypothetical protein